MPFDGLANSRLEKNPGYRESAPFFISQKPKRPRKKAFLDSSGLSGADNFGNMIKTVRTIGSNNYTTSYSYDLANRVTELIYPSGRYVDYTYDSSGYLTTVTTKPSSGGTVTTLASSITHKPFGPITGFTYGNSEALTKTYDDNYWLSTLNTVYSGTYVQELSFTEDNAGNLTAITDTLAAGRDETYTVDALNRLHTASGAYGSRTYTYDNNSNRATRVAGATTYTSTMTASTNLLASYTDGTSTRNFTYSASGNILTDDRTFIGGGALSNTFGGRDRLESMTVGTPTVTFKINALGQRVSKATTGSTTQFHFDIFGHIIGESDGSGNDVVEYVFMEGQLLAQIDSSGNIYYVHDNQVNAPQKITDSSRTLVWDYEIEPFGETYATPTSTTPTNHRFPGQYADSEDTLSYNNMRDYDPSIGRYAQADLLGLNAGPNLFAYAGQNPTEFIDPTGLDQSTVTVGWGPGVTVTWGTNHGQFNFGAFVGEGLGYSYNYNPNNAEAEAMHVEAGILGNAGLGGGLAGVDMSAYSSTGDKEACLSAGIPKKYVPSFLSDYSQYLSFSVAINQNGIEFPSASTTVGGSEFLGVGYKFYFPYVSSPP